MKIKHWFGLIPLGLVPVIFASLGSFQAGCGEYCSPTCRSGYTCVSQTCVTVCNPECDSGYTCEAATGECIADTTTTDTTTTGASVSAFSDDEGADYTCNPETEDCDEQALSDEMDANENDAFEAEEMVEDEDASDLQNDFDESFDADDEE